MRYFTYDIKDTTHPDFGKAIACEHCNKTNAWHQEQLEKRSGLPDHMKRWRYNTMLKQAHQQQAMSQLTRALKRGCTGMIALIGGNGVGKTHMLAATVNEARSQRISGYYNTTSRLLDHLRSAYAPGAGKITFDQLWMAVANSTVLALDEFSVYQPTQWAEDKFRMLMEGRYNERHDKLTLLAGNLALAKWPSWLRSRFRDSESQIIELAGGDMRPALGRQSRE